MSGLKHDMRHQASVGNVRARLWKPLPCSTSWMETETSESFSAGVWYDSGLLGGR